MGRFCKLSRAVPSRKSDNQVRQVNKDHLEGPVLMKMLPDAEVHEDNIDAAAVSGQTTLMSLATSVDSLRFEQLTQATKRSAIRCIVDLIGCAAAGRSTPGVDWITAQGTRWARGAFPTGPASVWFESEPLSALGAAFSNSLAASILDIDDGHRAAAGHPGAAIIPAVMAVGEVKRLQLKDAILAIVSGYQIGVSVGAARASGPTASVATGRWSAIGVAAAIGKLLGLSVTELAEAMALAESHAPNMAAADQAGFAGSHSKEGIPWSVVVGISAAEQAAVGLKGYLRGLDNPNIYTKGAIQHHAQSGLLIETTYFKPYACCRWIHSAIDAVLKIQAAGLDVSTVDRIEVASFKRALSLGNSVAPPDLISAQFSIPFVVSVALLHGAEALLPMEPDLLRSSEVRMLATRVALVLDEELDSCYPAQVPARVTIFTGTTNCTEEVFAPLGDPKNPLSDIRLVEKAVRLCAPLQGSMEIRQFAENLLGADAGLSETMLLSDVMSVARRCK
jgi:2-methylcitrate dehydratase PrpD